MHLVAGALRGPVARSGFCSVTLMSGHLYDKLAIVGLLIDGGGMEPAITVAVITAAVSVAGWVASYIASLLVESTKAKQAARLVHIERQLELLYGPLAFLIYEGRRTWQDLEQKLGRESIFRLGHPTPEELEVWLFWVDNDFMPRNAKIKELLAANTHLVTGDRLPTTYITFLDHYNSWEFEHRRWKTDGIEYSWHSKIDWPPAFEEEVLSTFNDLMREHAGLRGEISGA